MKPIEHSFGKIPMYEACRVYSKADRVLRGIINGLLEEFQITTMEWLLLGVVDQAPKTGITLSKIAEALDVSQPQITALMDGVVKQGMVRQRVHRHDRRSRTAVLTIKGKRLLDKIEENITAFMKTWLSEIPADQLKSHAEIIVRLSKYKMDG